MAVVDNGSGIMFFIVTFQTESCDGITAFVPDLETRFVGAVTHRALTTEPAGLPEILLKSFPGDTVIRGEHGRLAGVTGDTELALGVIWQFQEGGVFGALFISRRYPVFLAELPLMGIMATHAAEFLPGTDPKVWNRFLQPDATIGMTLMGKVLGAS